MTYSVDDVSELIRHHLVLSVDDDESADRNLAQLMRNIEQMVTAPRWREPVYWMVCEECGAWVSSELIGPDGAGENADGGFCCSECRWADK